MVVTAPQQSSEIICTHERRPGTTVCLHCRHAARIAARAKRQRLMLRAGAVGIVIVTIATAGLIGATAIRGRVRDAAADNRSLQPPTIVAQANVPEVVPNLPADSTPAAPPVTQEGITKPVAASTPSTPVASVAPLSPVIPIGPSTISDGITAVRADSGVTLSFDTPMLRTRIPAKFEQFVRTTLPAVYGHGLDSLLAKIPDGAIAGQGDLISELPGRGVRIPIGAAWMLRLYPETRPGQDGPLVVRYRVAVVPTHE
jgi:hypothetical protein